MATTTTNVAEQPKRSLVSRALYVLRVIVVNFLVFAVLMELLCIGFVHWKKWPGTRPSYRLNYNLPYVDTNPSFGRWHRPNDVSLNEEGCFSVQYKTNSYGARDVERSLHSTQPRTVVLGDSFMEGWGLPAEQRISNLLEQRTGREFMNFACGATGALQYALVYRTMAAAFDHKYVLVGVLPDNDFGEMDENYLNACCKGMYRPYYKPDFSIGYLGHYQPDKKEDFGDRTEAVLRAYLASFHVGEYVYSRTLDRMLAKRSLGVYSGYNDFTDIDLARMERALLDIKSTADAHGAQVSVFLMPRANDFDRLERRGTDRLGPVMESWGREAGIPVEDLLPEMEARSKGDYRSYFFSCDGHYSEKGDRVAADILMPWVSQIQK